MLPDSPPPGRMQRRIAAAALGIAIVPVAACAARSVPSAPTSLALRVVGHEHRWLFEYPGLDGIAGTRDDRTATGDLHIPADIAVNVELQSDDELYFFGVPDLGAKQIALPQRTYRLALGPQSLGRHDLLGDQLCGGSYPAMRGQLVVEEWPAFVEWLGHQPLSAGAGQSAATEQSSGS